MTKKYGERIAELREQRGMTQGKLASRLFCSTQTVSQWEAGYVTPTIDDLLNLCRVFGITTSFFFEEDGACECVRQSYNDDDIAEEKRCGNVEERTLRVENPKVRKKCDFKTVLKRTPWGILSGAFSIAAFFLTAGIVGAFMILDAIAKETDGRATLFQTSWQSAMFAFDIIFAIAIVLCVVMFILFEPKKKVIKRRKCNENIQ